MIPFTSYQWAHIITNIFYVYTIHIFMAILFDVKKAIKAAEMAAYAVAYLFAAAAYLRGNTPVVLLLVNLIVYLGLTFLYESTMKRRLLSVALLCMILMLAELMAYMLSDALVCCSLAVSRHFPAYSALVSRILFFAAALILNNFKRLREGEAVPGVQWFCVAMVPLSSIYIMLLIFQAAGLSDRWVFPGIAAVCLVNCAAFGLCEAAVDVRIGRMKSLTLPEQTQYYDRQLATMQSALFATRATEHDLRNHMVSLKTLVERSDIEEALGYIAGIVNEIGTGRGCADSGNSVVDSIVNFKFQEAEQRGIATDLSLEIPEKLPIPAFDMTVILGNLLDNAIKAASKVENGPFINLKMRCGKGRLMLWLSNPYLGEIVRRKGNLLTTEEDGENHGLGLESVRKVIRRYNGMLDIDYGKGLFSVTLLLYLDGA